MLNELKYNTQQRTLPMPEYGRSVQNMVDYALTIEDRAERQRCANTIIAIMGGMFPQLRDIPDFKHKLWDHLAIMSDFRLDIDYPYEVVKRSYLNEKPDPIPYQSSRIRYRHYGRLLEVLIQKIVDYPEGEAKQRLLEMTANFMKKEYVEWNKEMIDDTKIFQDIADYTHGKIQLTEADLQLMDLSGGQLPRSNFKSKKPKKKKK